MNDITNQNSTMDDIVFEGRNKQYGAYELRKIYGKYALRSIIIAFLSFSVFFFFAQVNMAFFKKKKEKEIVVETQDIEVEQQKAPDPTKPPPPPPPPPPQAPQIKFVEMIVKKDEEVEDDEVNNQDELKDAKQISDENKAGDPNSTIVVSEPDKGIVQVIEPTPPKKEEEPETNEIFTIVEDKPSFPGGQTELMKYLHKNIIYPDFARENQIKGTCVVEFVVERDGSISDIKILKDIGGNCGDEAVRVIKKMPAWTPGKQRGKPVRVKYTLPVQFKLQ